MTSLVDLPPPIIVNIASNLPDKGLFSLAILNQKMRELIRTTATTTPPICVTSPEEKENIRKLIQTYPNLTDVNISHSRYLTDDIIEFLVEKCPKISKLKLWNCLTLTDAALHSISRLTDLKWICLGDNQNFSNDGVTEVLKGCEQLETLDITLCTNVTSALAASIAEHGKMLKELIAEFCPAFATNDALTTIAGGQCRQLEKLIMGNGTASDEGIEALFISPLKDTLTILDFRRNAEIQQSGYDKIRLFPNIQEIDGVPVSSLPEEDTGAYFINKRAMYGDG
ncbi:hypothetical protein BLNAU_639 [Blattamonas nauphoetae]|uniref:F-box domain-containing protein n=1 Tax=Blattamonas nauphoetae TaxID=2049346 RepID=A0ABQ9YK32_9EUKA|nr:hypothetical protein BLNAU_639 [Blattamonas nauphoetae]